MALHLTSSGTTGQKSQMFFDAFTIGNARRMVDDVMQARGVASSAPANYLVNAYEPYEGLRVGTSNTNQYLMRYAPPARCFWSLRAVGEGQHEFDAFGALAALQDYAQDGVPTRIIGFPAFLHFALQRMQRLGMAPLRLPEGSCVIFGGGWKGHADQAIAKDALHASITHWLGIAPERIVETLARSEHSIPYVGCHPPPPACAHVVARAGARRAHPGPGARRSARLPVLPLALHHFGARAQRGHGRPGRAPPWGQLRLRPAHAVVRGAGPRRYLQQQELRRRSGGLLPSA